MMYFELLENMPVRFDQYRLGPGIYAKDFDVTQAVNSGIVKHCERIWNEVDGVVYYVKHRFPARASFSDVDMKEFMFIKLKAKML